jgi:hypothetical protein
MGVGLVGKASLMNAHSRTVGRNTELDERNRLIGRLWMASHSGTVGGSVGTTRSQSANKN